VGNISTFLFSGSISMVYNYILWVEDFFDFLLEWFNGRNYQFFAFSLVSTLFFSLDGWLL